MRDRDSECRDSVITNLFTLRLCTFHYKSWAGPHLGQVLQTAPLKRGKGIVCLMKCFGQLSLKGWTGGSVACPELFCKPTAVSVSCICRTVTYVSEAVLKRQMGLHRGIRGRENLVLRRTVLCQFFCANESKRSSFNSIVSFEAVDLSYIIYSITFFFSIGWV